MIADCGTLRSVYSTVIASLPDAPLIIDALESIFDQSCPPSEVIVVVDSDAEMSSAWARRIENDFPQTSIYRQNSVGMASAIAAGIRQTTSQYVAFLDGDDLWTREKQAVQIGVLEADSTVDAVTCLATNVEIRVDVSQQAMNPVPCATFTATTFRRSTFDTFGVPDGEAGHFIWLYRWWWNARRNGIRTGHVPEVGLIRRIDGNNSWSVSNELAHRELRLELRRLVGQRSALIDDGSSAGVGIDPADLST
jgi:glycosyltransferase involved in cell wall biosynthesis